jgi:hypothetical protein
MKPVLVVSAILVLAAPVLVESPSVLVVITQDKDGKAKMITSSRLMIHGRRSRLHTGVRAGFSGVRLRLPCCAPSPANP